MTMVSFDRFGRALLISLAVHGVLLWQAPLVRLVMSPAAVARSAGSGNLRAHLRPPEVVAAPDHALPAKAQRQRRILLGDEGAVGVGPVSATTAMQPVARLASSAAQARSPVQEAAQPAAENANVAEERIDANGLREYRIGLALAARQFRRYPTRAQQEGRTGRVELLVRVDIGGAPQPPGLLHSSGHADFDAAALDMLAQAIQQTRLPISLSGQSFSFPLRVEFNAP